MRGSELSREVISGGQKMKRKRYTEPQIVFALQQAEGGTSVAEICRKMGVAEQTFYRWKRRHADLLGTDPLRKL
jgi:putative transposase